MRREEGALNDVDLQAQWVAGAQCGVFTVHQLRAVGVTSRQIDWRLRNGRWERLTRRVLSLTGSRGGLERDLWIGLLHHGEPAVVSHTAAASLHGFNYLPHVEAELTLRYGPASRGPVGRLHRSVDLTGPDVVVVRDLPVTSVARTAADLLTVLGRKRVERIIDDLLNARRVTLDELAAVHKRYARGGRPGTVALREILGDRGPGFVAPDSELEQRTLELLVAHGLPAPERQAPVPGWRSPPGCVDFAYPDPRVIIETDGRRWHGHSGGFESDRRRDMAVQLAGWVILRFTWSMVTTDPGFVADTVRTALRRAA